MTIGEVEAANRQRRQLADMAIGHATRGDWESAVQANREIAVMSAIFAFGRRCGMANYNPCEGAERNTEQPRKGVRQLFFKIAEHLDFDTFLIYLRDIETGVLRLHSFGGLPLESPDYRYVDAGPDWATGGVWGPEGGAAGGLGMLGGIAYLYARRKSRRQELLDE